jgi:hypothetical protein
MRYRITMAIPAGVTREVALALERGVELEAAGFDMSTGTLVFMGKDGVIVAYNRDVWRTVAAVGAYAEAVKPQESPGENSARR